jgi:hypothetical protein
MPEDQVAGIPVTACRSCGARILFARHWATPITGKLMPIDAEPSPTGRVLIHPDRTYQIVTVERAADHAGELHVSHFATGTDPIRWRVK